MNTHENQTNSNGDEKRDPILERELILKEYEQVWQHFRYDADGRMKYMNFFFGILSASGAVILAISQYLENTVSYEIWMAILLFMSAFTTYIYIGVIKHSNGTTYYDRVLKNLRREFIERKIVKLITIDYIKPKDVKRIYGSTRTHLEFFLIIFFIIIHLSSIAVLIYNWDKHKDLSFIMLVLIYVILLSGEVYLIVKTPKIDWYRYPDDYISGRSGITEQ